MKHFTSVYIAFVVLVTALAATADERDQARRIHDRLTGVPPTDAMLNAMAGAVGSGDAVTAALYAIDGAPGVAATGQFYTTVLKNWSTPWTNEAQDAFAPLNDYSATVIGAVRDELDFREILSADLIYVGARGNLPAYSDSNNDHYEALENAGSNLGDPQELSRRTQSNVTGLAPEAVAGVLTSRAAARAFFVDGTNRAMFRFTLLNHLCLDLEQVKDGTRPADRIRQDISRSPGGDSRLFLNSCVDCHAGMDPLAQAFAYYDFPYPDEEEQPGLELELRKDLGRLVYTEGVVQGKYLINSASFPTGYVTPDDHWTNYWRLGDNSARIGWRLPADNTGSSDLARNPAYAEGDGAASLGWELANTEAFAQCQVKKAFRSICVREPGPGDAASVSGFVSVFHGGGNMKQVFARVAAYCAADL
ncbi:hypothetical protein C0039_13915 [Pseudohalioglobus lutimaris]|uniref:DUF1585 domain-containing protein n=1 Tax=Pseudohalioglobus lutimaris TaxID=1737061 RepID=A0A2N5X0X4_9GAMM|nr:hypothetical protein C0039_13915 [Pseudohalioglobus lutimaris]